MEQAIDKETQEITTQRDNSAVLSPDSALTTAQSVSLPRSHASYFGITRAPYNSTTRNSQSSFNENQLNRIDGPIIDLTKERDACKNNSSRQLKDEKITALNLLKEISYRYSNPQHVLDEFSYQAKLTIIESGYSSRVKQLLDDLKNEVKMAAIPGYGK